MTKVWLKILACCVCLSAANVLAATQSQIDEARIKGLWWLYTHQNGDGSWGKTNAAVASTASALEALNKAGLRGPLYGRGYSWLANAPALSVDSLARKISAIRISGGDTRGLVAELLAARNTLQAWGSYKGYDISYPDTGLALHALKGETSYTNEELLRALCLTLVGRRTSEGWSYAKADSPLAARGAILPTANTILGLVASLSFPIQNTNYNCGAYFVGQFAVNDSVTTFTAHIGGGIANGTVYLTSQRNADNGFGANGASTVIETAFVYQALLASRTVSLGISQTATDQTLDYLLSRQNAVDGSWQGDAFQTALILSLLPPPATSLTDSDKDGVPDAVEVLAGTNPNANDSRGLASGNGDSVTGLTVPTLLAAAAQLGLPFSHQLTTLGGTPPYAWKITAGSLPSGITLNSTTGLISGTPTALGSYAFFYTVTDAASPANTLANVVAAIDVVQSQAAASLLPNTATGDINGDGVVDLADVILAERVALGLTATTPAQLQRGDVAPAANPDGVIDAADVIGIQRKVLGLTN